MKKTILVFMAIIVVSFFVSCNKEKLITLTENSATLHHGETYQINAECENPILFSSENEYHAKVSSSGLVTANYIGNTTITLQSEDDSKVFSVTVSPRSNLYREPNISIGDSSNEIIQKLGSPDYTNDDSFGYYNYSLTVPLLLVSFDNSGCVEYYGVVVKTDYTNELDVFLEERYEFVSYYDGIFIYRNGLSESTTTMYIGMELYNIDYWIILYAPADLIGSCRKLDVIKHIEGLIRLN